MRNLYTLDAHRLNVGDTTYPSDNNGDDKCGAFQIRSKIDGQPLCIIASAYDGWDHVSVSRKTRCPNWDEMEQIKRLFFEDHECAMQLHVPVSEHRCLAPYCLHIWRPHHAVIPMPPADFVAPVESITQFA